MGKSGRIIYVLTAALVAVLAASSTFADTQTDAQAGTKSKGSESAKAKSRWRVDSSIYKSADQAVIGSLDKRTGYLFQLELVNESAAIRTLKLSQYFDTVEAKMAFDADPDGYLLGVKNKQKQNPAASDGSYCLLSSVEGKVKKKTIKHLPLATHKLTLKAGDEDAFEMNIPRWETLKKTNGDDGNSESYSFRWEAYHLDEDDSVVPYLRVTKTYTVTKGDATVVVSLKFENLSAETISVQLDQRGPTGVPLEDKRSDRRACVYGVMNADNGVDVSIKNYSALQKFATEYEQLKYDTRQLKRAIRKIKDTKQLKDALEQLETNEKRLAKGPIESLGESDSKTPTLWIGQTNKFFGALMYLRPEVKGRLQAANYGAEFYYESAKESPTSVTHITSVSIPELCLDPGKTRFVVFDLYAGPKKRSIFTDKDDPQFKPLYAELNYKDTITFGSGCFCAVPGLASGMMWLLSILSMVAFGNYGIAIFILVIFVRVVLHPLTKKGQVSMMKMQKNGPELERVKKKYADDKDTLNKETMRLYKEQGATPILGCLPMMLQMPIWIALYSGLNSLVDLRHAAFLPVWITDLSSPDALFMFPTALPLIGNTFNLLPLLLCVAMYFQTKYGPQSASSTPEQQKSQQMMKYMMPVMMLMFFYKAPSGLNLYIMTSTAASVMEQIIIRKHIKEKEEAEALAATVIDIPGKRSRNTREKKPKGPNWVKRG